MESSNITGSVFSDAFPLYQASKRSEVTDEDENKEILEATEADIAHYVIKGNIYRRYQYIFFNFNCNGITSKSLIKY